MATKNVMKMTALARRQGGRDECISGEAISQAELKSAVFDSCVVLP